jgi:hypothetical protein
VGFFGERGSWRGGEVRERKEWEKEEAGGLGGVGKGRAEEAEGNVEGEGAAEEAFFRCCC